MLAKLPVTIRTLVADMIPAPITGQPPASLTYPMVDGFTRQCGPAAK